MLDQDENLRNAIEHEIQVLQAQKQAIQQERADIAAQTKKAAGLSKKAEEESALVQRGLAKSPPDPHPPRIGAAANQREQKALQKYRGLTSVERRNFERQIRSYWLQSCEAATDVVANAQKSRKRRTLLSQFGVVTSEMIKEVYASIVDRAQIAKDVKAAEQVRSWAIADMRADLYRAVIACSQKEYFSFDKKSKLDQQFYHKLTRPWAESAWAGDDPGLSNSLAPAWATKDDGRTLADKFALARKYASGDAEIAVLERAERAGRCTPGDTLHLLNEMAGKLRSAIEHKAVPAAHEKLWPFMAAAKKPSSLKQTFAEFAGPLYDKALCESSGHRVSEEALAPIAEQLDGSKFAEPLEYLEPRGRARLAKYNQTHSNQPIKSWTRLISKPAGPSIARRALNRAAENYRK